jgi:hypothetical protein
MDAMKEAIKRKMEGLHKGGHHPAAHLAGPPEGSPQEEASETPQEEQDEQQQMGSDRAPELGKGQPGQPPSNDMSNVDQAPPAAQPESPSMLALKAKEHHAIGGQHKPLSLHERAAALKAAHKK